MRVDKLVTGFRCGLADVLQFNVEDCANFTKAALQILLPGVLRKTADIDLVRLKGQDGRHKHQVRTADR